jgi:hypothetical protein
MDDLLWMYLQNVMLNVDGVRCAIFMMPADVTSEISLYYRGGLTRHGRVRLTVADFSLGVEAYMRSKNVNMCVRTTMREAWYKSLLKSGNFAIYFRFETDHQNYINLEQQHRPFLVT